MPEIDRSKYDRLPKPVFTADVLIWLICSKTEGVTNKNSAVRRHATVKPSNCSTTLALFTSAFPTVTNVKMRSIEKGRLTSVPPPQRLRASSVFDHAEEAGEAVGEAVQDRAVPGGGGASPGRASSSAEGSLLEAPQAPVPGGGTAVQSGGGS